VDYIHNLPQILTKTAQQQQAQSRLQHPSKGLDSSKVEHHFVQHHTGTIGAHRGVEVIFSFPNIRTSTSNDGIYNEQHKQRQYGERANGDAPNPPSPDEGIATEGNRKSTTS